jgi:hypothetical protein
MDICLLCLYVVLSCVGWGLWDGLITRLEESYRVSNSVSLRNLKGGGQGPIWAVEPMDGWIWEENKRKQLFYPPVACKGLRKTTNNIIAGTWPSGCWLQGGWLWDRVVKLTTHLYLILRSKIHGAEPPCLGYKKILRLRNTTQRHDRMISTLASYSESPEFKSRFTDRLAWLKFSWFSSSLQGKCWERTQTDPQSYTSLIIYYSFIIPSPDAIKSDITSWYSEWLTLLLCIR